MNKLDLNVESDKKIYDEACDFILKNLSYSNHTYGIIVRTENGPELHTRISRPCFGELRRYREKSNNRKEDRFPSDLLNNFPKGTPIALAVVSPRLNPKHNQFVIDNWTKYSPWISNNREIQDNLSFIHDPKTDTIKGVFINTGDFLPAHLVAHLMWMRNVLTRYQNIERLKFLDIPLETCVILSSICHPYNTSFFLNANSIIGNKTDLNLLFNKTPQDVDGGMLWSEGCDYNRPGIMNAFENKEKESSLTYQVVQKDMLRTVLDIMRE